MSKYLKNKLKSLVNQRGAKDLRALADITQEHNNTAYYLGVAEYNISLLEQEASNLRAKMRTLNQEASTRKEYDKANPPVLPSTPISQGQPKVTK